MAKINVLGNEGYIREFGRFDYQDRPDGSIRITDQTWLSQNITTVTLKDLKGPGRSRTVECHVRAKEPLRLAFEEIADKGLSGLITTFDGLWVPRHMTWNRNRPLSSHSWGIAFDLNASSNPYGGGVTAANIALDKVFNRYGFAWGGDFRPDRDGMHWELARPDAYRALTSSTSPRPALILAVYRGKSRYSYHRLKTAKLAGNAFTADRVEIGQLLGRESTAGVGVVREILAEFGATTGEEGDHLNDVADPRYYLFVIPAA